MEEHKQWSEYERVKIRERSRAKTEINRGKREPKKERNKTR